MTRPRIPRTHKNRWATSALFALALGGCFMRGYEAYPNDATADAPSTRPDDPSGTGPDDLEDGFVPGGEDRRDPESDPDAKPPPDASAAARDAGSIFDARTNDAQTANLDSGTADGAPAPTMDAAGEVDTGDGATLLARCVGQGTCSPTCAAGQTCELDCADAGLCNPTCADGSFCNIQCEQAGNCNVSCEGTARCRVDCRSNANCPVQCDELAVCSKYCHAGGPCTIPSCTGGTAASTMCVAGTIGFVCHGGECDP